MKKPDYQQKTIDDLEQAKLDLFATEVAIEDPHTTEEERRLYRQVAAYLKKRIRRSEREEKAA
jgi:hypothetical protein